MKGISVTHIPAKNWHSLSKWHVNEIWLSHCGYTVHKGLISDGGSIPFIFRLLVNPTGRNFSAFIVHDCALDDGLSWTDALGLFEKQLVAIGNSEFRIKSLSRIVRFYGKKNKL